MPRPRTLNISEIFASVQGEGLRQGEPTHFIRLAGCNLRCAFCDTKYALEDGRRLTVGSVLRRLDALGNRFPSDWVCLTGGEPFLQDISDLIDALGGRSYKVQIETNGTLFRQVHVDWLTVSPKPPRFEFRPEWREVAREIKLVASRDLDLDTVLRLRDSFPRDIPLLLQPQSQRVWSRHKALDLLREAARAGRSNLRLSLQLHRVYDIR